MATQTTNPTRNFAPIDFKTRFPALDGLRALAVTTVFLVHYGMGRNGGTLVRLLKRTFIFGGYGVDLFFVLSGFLITGILYDTRADSRYFARFFARRSVRIFPVYYLVIAVLLLLTLLFHYEWRPAQAWFLVYMGNFAANANPALWNIASPNHPMASLTIAPFWSLCVEEQFYLLWPLAVWLIRDRVKLIRTAGGIAALSLGLRVWLMLASPQHVDWLFRTLPFRLDTLLFGAMLALLLRGPAADRVQRACKWLFLIGVALFFGCYSISPRLDSTLMTTLGLTLDALAFTGLIGATLRRGSPAFRVFNLATLRFIGRYSYGFYIFHYLFSSAWIAYFVWASAVTHSVVLGGFIALATNYGVTLLLAFLSYRLFEVRFLRFKRHFEYDAEVREHRHAFTTAG